MDKKFVRSVVDAFNARSPLARYEMRTFKHVAIQKQKPEKPKPKASEPPPKKKAGQVPDINDMPWRTIISGWTPNHPKPPGWTPDANNRAKAQQKRARGEL